MLNTVCLSAVLMRDEFRYAVYCRCLLAWFARIALLLIDHAVLHDESNIREYGNVLPGIAWDCHYVRQISAFQRTDLSFPAQ